MFAGHYVCLPTGRPFCLPPILFASLLKKRSTLKGKNLLPLEANSFLLEYPFQKGFGVWKSKQDITEVVSLVKNGRKSTKSIHIHLTRTYKLKIHMR